MKKEYRFLDKDYLKINERKILRISIKKFNFYHKILEMH